MKKTPYIIWMIVLGILWIFALSTLFSKHWIGFILSVFVLVAPTIRIVRGFLTIVSNERSQKNNPEDNSTSITQTSQSDKSNTKMVFCIECGAHNLHGSKYCESCGKQLK